MNRGSTPRIELWCAHALLTMHLALAYLEFLTVGRGNAAAGGLPECEAWSGHDTACILTRITLLASILSRIALS